MKKIITNIVFATLVAITAISAEATVKPETLAGEFFEGRNISIRGKNISTAVTLTTVDGQTFNLTGIVNKPANKLTLQLPLISADSKVKLTFADKDGSTSVNIVVYNDPTLANGGLDLFGNAPVLPASIETGIAGAPGPQGPEGPEGPTGPQGAPGSVPTSIPGANVVGPVASANIVIANNQPNITTLPALVSIGTNAIPTVFAGPITANQPITGNIIGNSTNFTGNLAGDITGTQGATVLSQAVLFGKTLPAHTASAAVVTTGDSLEVAIEKLDGNVLANDADITAIQGVNTTQSSAISAIEAVNATQTTNIATNTTAIGAPTALNTANQIVKRDGTGNFAAGTITATSFVGNLTGTVTGNATGSAATFTGALAGDVTGTQAATVLQPAALFAKQLQAGYASLAGPVAINDTLEVVLEKLDGNIKANVVAINNNATNINTNTNNIAAINTVNATQTANITANANAITAIQAVNTMQNTDIGNLTADVAAIEAVNTSQTTDITALQGVNTTQTTDINALETRVDNLTSVTNVTLAGTSFSATDKSVVVLIGSALDTITDGVQGQRLTIVFVGGTNVTDLGGNINLSGTMNPINTTADDVLELVYTGTGWKQISYSNN